MKFPLFSKVAVKVNIKKYNLKKGDVVRIVHFINASTKNLEPAYSVEVSNILGELIDVFIIEESKLQKLNKNQIPSARVLQKAS